jgi:hypothetical protein
MATRAVAAALALGLLALGCGCGGDEDAEPQAGTVEFSEVGLALDVPAELADLTYSIGTSEEGQPTLDFSTKELASLGGATCAAGAQASVSSYPLGQIVVSDESPEHVREEARENPEENLGAFVKKVDDHYLYYVAPPSEACATGNSKAAQLQLDQTAALHEALDSLHSGR